jgi:L-seryl-tRNA(Ser) seleniumtransferase
MAYHAGRATTEVPAVEMLSLSADAIEGRAQGFVERLHPAGWRVALMSGASAVGGGSAPGVELPTVLVALAHSRLSADALERQLRQLDPPVIARIESDHVLLDLRTVSAGDEEMLVTRLVDLGARLAQ